MSEVEDLAAAADELEEAADALAGGGGLFSGVTKTESFTTAARRRYFPNTTAGVITATLHADAAEGDMVQFLDLDKSWGTHDFTIVPPAGKTIDGDSSLIAHEPMFIWLAYYGGNWHVVQVLAIGTIPAGLDLEERIAPAVEPGDGESDKWYTGPGPDWLMSDDARITPAVDPTGVADSTAGLQLLLDIIATDGDDDNGIPRALIGNPAGDLSLLFNGTVAGIQPGRYRITDTLVLCRAALKLVGYNEDGGKTVTLTGSTYLAGETGVAILFAGTAPLDESKTSRVIGVRDGSDTVRIEITEVTDSTHAVGTLLDDCPAGLQATPSSEWRIETSEATFEDKSIIGNGDAPRDVVFVWDGPSDRGPLWINGAHTSKFARFRFECAEGKTAPWAIRFERDPRLQLTSQSHNQYEDIEYGPGFDVDFHNTQDRGLGSNSGTDSEQLHVGCRYYEAAKAALANVGIQSFDFWMLWGYLEACRIGITNGLRNDGIADDDIVYPFDENDPSHKTNAIGAFHVFGTQFNGSTFADIVNWGKEQGYIARNFSQNANRFAQLRAAYFGVILNTIVNSIQSDAIRFETADRGNTDANIPDTPQGRQRSLAMQNRIKSRPDATGPVINENYSAQKDTAWLEVGAGNPFTNGSLFFHRLAKPMFMAWANEFSRTGSASELIATDPTYDNTIVSGTLTGQTIDDSVPLRRPMAAKVSRQTFIVGSGGLTVQQTVDAWAAYAEAHAGSEPVLYIPNRAENGFMTVSQPVVVPGGIKGTIQGSGPLSRLSWDDEADPDDPRPYWLFEKPCKVTIADCGLGQQGGTHGKTGVCAIFEEFDTSGGRIHVVDGSGRFSVYGHAHARIEYLGHSFDSNLDGSLPILISGSTVSSGSGVVLLQMCTFDNGTSGSTIEVHNGGRVDIVAPWHESTQTNQVSLVASGGAGARRGELTIRHGRWLDGNDSPPPSSGGTNWRHVKMRVNDFDGDINLIGTRVPGQVQLSGDCSNTGLLVLGGDLVPTSGGSTPGEYYRNHGPLMDGEQFQIGWDSGSQTGDTSPVGVSGSLPADWETRLATINARQPTMLVDELGSGVTDVRMYRVYCDMKFLGDVYEP